MRLIPKRERKRGREGRGEESAIAVEKVPAVSWKKKNILIPSSFKSYCKRRGEDGRGRVELFRGDGNDFGIKYDDDGTARRVAGALRGRSPVIAALVGYFNSGWGERAASSFPMPGWIHRGACRSGKLNSQRYKFYCDRRIDGTKS